MPKPIATHTPSAGMAEPEVLEARAGQGARIRDERLALIDAERDNAVRRKAVTDLQLDSAGRTHKDIKRAQKSLAVLARTYSADAVRTLGRLMMDPDIHPAVRLTAADKLLDRGFGRAIKGDEMGAKTTDTGAIADMSRAELLALISAEVPPTPIAPEEKEREGEMTPPQIQNQDPLPERSDK